VAHLVEAGDVGQHIQAAERGDAIGDGLLTCRRIRDFHRCVLSARHGLEHLGHPLGIPRDAEDRRAALGEQRRGRGAQARRRSGYQRDLAIQLSHGKTFS
jgi:hypothetical protein